MTIDRSELRRLCEAATPGPWRLHKHAHAHVTSGGGENVANCGGAQRNFDREQQFSQQIDNATFVAAARTALPALLDALEAAEARERRLRDALATIKTAAGNAVWNAGQGKRAAGEEYDRCWKHVSDIASKALAETAP